MAAPLVALHGVEPDAGQLAVHDLSIARMRSPIAKPEAVRAAKQQRLAEALDARRAVPEVTLGTNGPEDHSPIVPGSADRRRNWIESVELRGRHR